MALISASMGYTLVGVVTQVVRPYWSNLVPSVEMDYFNRIGYIYLFLSK